MTWSTAGIMLTLDYEEDSLVFSVYKWIASSTVSSQLVVLSQRVGKKNWPISPLSHIIPQDNLQDWLWFILMEPSDYKRKITYNSLIYIYKYA